MAHLNPQLQLRPAVVDDLPAINDIYNHYVRHSTCTYQELDETLADRQAWFAGHGERHPVIVATVDDAIVGWGSLSPYNNRSAYRFTVENSVYVRHDMHRGGIGSAILSELIDRAGKLGHRAIIAGIDADQPASIALHARLGFIQAGRVNQVGHKFGRWLDVCYMQLLLPPRVG